MLLNAHCHLLMPNYFRHAKVTSIRQQDLEAFFKSKGSLCYCCDTEGLFGALRSHMFLVSGDFSLILANQV